MEKRDNGKVIAVIALFVAVAGLSIGFATLSTSLNIKGGATVKAADWDLNFGGEGSAGEDDKPTKPQNEGETKAEQVEAPKFESTSATFNVRVTAPGDKISYKFKAANDGGIDAQVTGIVPTDPTCTATEDEDNAKAENLCKKIKITLTTDDGQPVAAGQKLPAGEGDYYIWTLTFDEKYELTAEELPKGKINVTGSKIVVSYGQADAA